MEDSGRTCTYSFGDDGVTATTSPSGRLLRISRHFRGEKFGYCVDHWSIPDPYQVVDRITSFLSAANDPDHNIGFYPDQDGWASDAKVSADFTDDRWPVFDIQGEDGTCKIQYSISDGAVYQTFEFKNGRPPMVFMPSLLIRRLDFSGLPEFSDASKCVDEYKTQLLDGGKCIKRSHKLAQDGHKHVALFVYAYSDNISLTFEEPVKSKDLATKKYSGIGEQGKKVKGEVNGKDDDAEVTCYKISDVKEMSTPTKVTFIYVLSLESGGLESLKPLKFIATPEFDKTGASKIRKLTENPELNIALRRNLEYILSVCSIPVYPDAEDDKEFAVALTCGDVDSHRVAAAASL